MQNLLGYAKMVERTHGVAVGSSGADKMGNAVEILVGNSVGGL